MKLINKLLNYLGIDGAIFYTSLGRILQGLGGIITLILISKFMSKEEQGFYYTFSSVLAIQIFFELGLGGILTQFVAHEMAHLKLVNNTFIEGKQENRSRLASILHFSLKWYALFALLLVLILIVAGFFYFSKYAQSSNVNWELPWVLVAIFTSLNLLISPIMAILQGMQKVKEMAKVLMMQQLIVMLSVWIGLTLGAKLYIAVINSAVAFIVLTTCYIHFSYIKLLKNAFKYFIKEKVDYWKEIFPYQWKIALSWMSGYFIFQVFNPIIFAFYGPIAAGQIGMTLVLVNAMVSLIVNWSATKIPKWSSLIAQKKYLELNNSLNIVLKQIVFISVITILLANVAIIIGNYLQLGIMQRILPAELCFSLFLVVPFNAVIFTWAGYLRSNKKEPFLYLSLIIGIITFLQIYISAKYFDIATIIIGYASVIIFINFPMAYYIFKIKKKEYYGTV